MIAAPAAHPMHPDHREDFGAPPFDSRTIPASMQIAALVAGVPGWSPLDLLSDAAFYREASDRALQISREQSDLRPFASPFHAAVQQVVRQSPFCHSPFPAKPVTPGDTAANILA